MARHLAIGLVLVAAALTTGAAQQPPGSPSTFQASTDVVQVDVSVLDRRRKPVKGLTAGDFEVLEDGHPRPIAAFVPVDLPGRVPSTDAAWTRDVPPDVATNQTSAAGGRIVIILMDRTIPHGGFPTLLARNVATAAVNALGPGDVAAVMSTSGAVPQNLTSDRPRLLAAINQRRDWATDVSDEAKEIEGAVAAAAGGSPEIFGPLTDGRCLCGLCVLETVTNVARALEGMPRQRKSLLFVGSDIIFQDARQVPTMDSSAARADLGCGRRLEDARRVMFSALDRSGVIVHSIDPSGLQATGPTGRASSTLHGVDVRSAYDSAVRQLLQRQGNLDVLPSRTGGRVVANTNQPEDFVPDIIHESDAYYLIGYRPAEPQTPGQTRKIEVKVRRPGVKVSARREYVVPAVAARGGDASRSALGPAMRSTLPVADSPLAITASSFGVRGSSTAAVAVAIDLSSIAAIASRPDGTRGPVTIAVAAYDVHGRPTGAVDVVSVTNLSGGGSRGLEAFALLDLPPGDHELRAAVVAEGTGRGASVFTHITVPPFAGNPLTLSHIAIAATADTDTIQHERLANLLPIVPTTGREFSRTRPVTAFLQVYQGLERNDAIRPALVTTSVIDRAGVVRLHEARNLETTAFGDRRTATCLLNLDVSRLEPGEYLLTIAASAGALQAGRAIRFAVR